MSLEKIAMSSGGSMYSSSSKMEGGSVVWRMAMTVSEGSTSVDRKDCECGGAEGWVWDVLEGFVAMA